MQRRITFAIVLVAAILIGAASFASGAAKLDFSTMNFNDFLVALAAPLLLSFTTLAGIFDVIDSRVAAGKMDAGDVVALFLMPEWYAGILSIIAGEAQFLNIAVINPNTQAMLVDLFLGAATLLFRTLSNRPNGSNITTITLVNQKAISQRTQG
jgi:hypothetical protein